ncbi:hypothetical protein ACFX13_007442 [Malus domestica]
MLTVEGSSRSHTAWYSVAVGWAPTSSHMARHNDWHGGWQGGNYRAWVQRLRGSPHKYALLDTLDVQFT